MLLGGPRLIGLDESGLRRGAGRRDRDGVPGPDDLAEPDDADRPPGERGPARARLVSSRRARAMLEVLDEVGLPRPTVAGPTRTTLRRMRQRAMIAASIVAPSEGVDRGRTTTALDVAIQQQILELVDAPARTTTGWLSSGSPTTSAWWHGSRTACGDVCRPGRRVRDVGTCSAAPSIPTPTGRRGRCPPDRPHRQPSLSQIGGQPWQLASLPPAAPFAPRCPQRVDKCLGRGTRNCSTGAPPAPRAGCPGRSGPV